MTLYFEIGVHSWVCVHDCYDWEDALKRVEYYFDLRNMRCVNHEEFKLIKENVVFTF